MSRFNRSNRKVVSCWVGTIVLALLCSLCWAPYTVPVFAQTSGMLQEWLKLKNRGSQAEVDKKFDEAMGLYERALSIAESVSTHGPQTEETLVRLANVALLKGDLDLADRYYTRVIRIANTNQKRGKLDREALVWLEDLADTYEVVGVNMSPVRALQHAADIREFTKNPRVKGTLENLIRVHISLGENELAYTLAKRCIAIDRAMPASAARDMGLGCDLTLLASLEFDKNNVKEAEKLVLEGLPLIAKTKKDKKQCLAESGARTVLARVLISKGEYDRAEKELALAEPLMAAAGGNGTYLEVPYMVARSALSLKRKKPKVALQWLEKEFALLEQSPAVLTEVTLRSLNTRLDELKLIGQSDAATKFRKRLAVVMSRRPGITRTPSAKSAVVKREARATK